MLRIGYITALMMLLLVSCKKQDEKPIDQIPLRLTQFVNPFIGTDGPGNTYPGATVPFGMVQLSPDIGIPGWDRIAGYFYQDSIITGFSHTHLSGTGAGDLYDILVMPTNSRFSKTIKENNFKPFSYFSHNREGASPGYYHVTLDSYGIEAEVTATERTGIHRYSFPKDSISKVHVDLGYAINWDAPVDTYIKVVDDSTIEGYRFSTGWAKNQRIYFVMKFSRPFSGFEIFENDSIASSPVYGKNTRISLQYTFEEPTELVIKTSLSTASIDGAYATMKVEAPHFNFDSYKGKAELQWDSELSKIKVETSDENQKTIFYSMLYQSMLAPTLLSDVSGNYKAANDSIGHADGFDRYDTFSLWDTFRAAHPLYTILHTQRVPHFIASLLAHYKETGLLPVWSMQGNETNMMIGYHAVPVIVDAYFKGIHMDAELAYQACKASALDSSRQIDLYQKYGYVPKDEHHENWSVSKTVEYAFADWCIAMFAKDMGYMEDYSYFLKRSENWKNHFDQQSTFLRPKDRNGTFVSPFIPKEYTNYYCESNAWHYFWFVPQDIPQLIELTGGEERFSQKLDSMFSYSPTENDKLPLFSTGMIGQYAHGNEPSHHVAYLYNYIGKPSETQKRVRQILETQYRNEPNGHCGNEDCGQMSSWYVLSSLGIYPVNPAQGVYHFGTPLFPKATLNLENKHRFSIIANKLSKENKYIKSIRLNGHPLKRLYITHKEIMAGGVLEFEMDAKPHDEVFKHATLPATLTIY